MPAGTAAAEAADGEGDWKCTRNSRRYCASGNKRAAAPFCCFVRAKCLIKSSNGNALLDNFPCATAFVQSTKRDCLYKEQCLLHSARKLDKYEAVK